MEAERGGEVALGKLFQHWDPLLLSLRRDLWNRSQMNFKLQIKTSSNYNSLGVNQILQGKMTRAAARRNSLFRS